MIKFSDHLPVSPISLTALPPSPLSLAWLAHAGSVLFYRCVLSALGKSADYRGSVEGTNWNDVTEGVTLTTKDMRLIWLLIQKEVSGDI